MIDQSPFISYRTGRAGDEALTEMDQRFTSATAERVQPLAAIFQSEFGVYGFNLLWFWLMSGSSGWQVQTG